eukprot:TCALIF_07232-PA protein Name:"Protein of unknown function" AED:0.87 eAED:0.87 QI:0/0/0/0.33/1/1/3/159/170
MTGVADFQIGERDPTEELIFSLSPNLVNFLAPAQGMGAQDNLQFGRAANKECLKLSDCGRDQLACVDNICSRDRHIIELPKFCSAINPFGYCEPGYECRSGICMSANACDANNWNGICPRGEVCKNGICVDKFHQCSKRNFQGFCPYGEECREGTCQKENLCSENNPEGD